MLHETITSKGVMRTVAYLIADDLKEELAVFQEYTVETEVEDRNYVFVRVFSDAPCCIITSPVMENIIKVYKLYRMRYTNVTAWVTTVEKRGRNIPAFQICISVS